MGKTEIIIKVHKLESSCVSLCLGFVDSKYESPDIKDFKDNVVGLCNRESTFNCDFSKFKVFISENEKDNSNELNILIDFDLNKICFNKKNGKTIAYSSNFTLFKSGRCKFAIFNKSGKNEIEFVSIKHK